jgi:hypothetical protein
MKPGWIEAAVLGVLCAVGSGCTWLLDSDGTQCTTNTDCARFGAVCDRETSVCKPEVIVSLQPATAPSFAPPASSSAAPDASTVRGPDANAGTTGGPGAGLRDAGIRDTGARDEATGG